MENPGENFLKELYEDWIYGDFDYIKFIHSENKVLQSIRERNQDDGKIVELCKEALFENANLISFLKERIEDVTSKCRKIR